MRLWTSCQKMDPVMRLLAQPCHQPVIRHRIGRVTSLQRPRVETRGRPRSQPSTNFLRRRTRCAILRIYPGGSARIASRSVRKKTDGGDVRTFTVTVVEELSNSLF